MVLRMKSCAIFSRSLKSLINESASVREIGANGCSLASIFILALPENKVIPRIGRAKALKMNGYLLKIIKGENIVLIPAKNVRVAYLSSPVCYKDLTEAAGFSAF